MKGDKSVDNKTLMQYFEWYLPANCTLWHKLKEEAEHLKKIGITGVWLPPAYKASAGVNDVGYAVYDLYDLGEFNQRGTVPTKYGTKDQYIEAIEELHKFKIKVIADIVFNQRMGADATEDVLAVEEKVNNRNEAISKEKIIKAWTIFNFGGRNNKYSDFKWNWTHFHGTDWDEKEKRASIYRFYGKHWDESVDKENGNYDYLMGADVDLNNMDVVEELKKWGKWYLETTGIDGFRLDALKHIRSDFFRNWLEEMQEESEDKRLISIGEYWKNDVDVLQKYIEEVEHRTCLFDVPLHYNLFEASRNQSYDMSKILHRTLVERNPGRAITFVDNHDTEPGQALESAIMPWFKEMAYTIILLRKEGIPCIFYGDYYGIRDNGEGAIQEKLDKLLYARKNLVYGEQRDYFDNHNVIGWVIEGDEGHPDSGLVVIMSNAGEGCKTMNIGEKLANTVLYDLTGNRTEKIYVDNEGNGIFYCNPGSVSVWIKEKKR